MRIMPLTSPDETRRHCHEVCKKHRSDDSVVIVRLAEPLSWLQFNRRYSGGARNFFLPGCYRGAIISNGAHLTVAQRPSKACEPGPFFKPTFPDSEFATNSTCVLCGMH